MLKRRVIGLIAGVTLMMAVLGAASVVADSLGVSLTPQVFACNNGSGAGGHC